MQSFRLHQQVETFVESIWICLARCLIFQKNITSVGFSFSCLYIVSLKRSWKPSPWVHWSTKGTDHSRLLRATQYARRRPHLWCQSTHSGCLAWKKDQTNPPISETLLPVQTDDVLETDEMWSFVCQRANKRWIWMVMFRGTHQIVACVIGERSERTCRKLWEQIPSSYQPC